MSCGLPGSNKRRNESDTMGEEEDGKDDGDGDGGETANEEDGDVEVEVEKRREAKAKAKARGKAKGKSADGSTNTVDVRLRLSDALKDITLTVRKDQRVFAIERQLRSECEIPPTARIYMLHQGRLLRSHQSLLDQGWVVGNVVNVFVARDPQDA
ncbi:Ubiquitin domain-containing protein 2 [Ascosphaera atra]|nr:Ubiquitin domain-containing protein 2 [Ascosphaera atra]